VILGVSRLEQLEENLGAQGVVDRLEPPVMAELDELCPLEAS
jgi:aryl-alcohol dehydrogenase-like predicted oxidoreductase